MFFSPTNTDATFAAQCVAKSRRRKRNLQSYLNVFLKDVSAELEGIGNEGDIGSGRNDKDVIVVIGNQAADADSIVSAIVLAFLRHRASSFGRSCLYVPMVCAPRRDLEQLHPLEPFLLQPHVDMERLIYVDEHADRLSRLRRRGKLRMILTDHNKLAPALNARFGDVVCEIYDHHSDKKCYLPRVSGSSRHIAFDEAAGSGVGSCCTVVASLPVASKQNRRFLADSGVARLLLDVILVDTIGLSENAGKTKPEDVAAAEKLQAIVQHGSLQERFRRLSSAKNDPSFWAKKSVAECLRYDFKKYSVRNGTVRYGASSVPVRLDVLAQKSETREAFVCTLLQWMRANDLLFLLVLTMVMNEASGEAEREIAVVYRSEHHASRKLVDYLERKTDLNLRRIGCTSDAESTRALSLKSLSLAPFAQGNMKRSRKRITPLVDAFLSSGEWAS
eukprot:g3818.t1